MITKLKLTNFKSFKQAEINFGPVSILVGANATGKSNVRDALRFLHGIGRGYNLAEIIGEKYGEGDYIQWNGIRGGTREICFFSKDTFKICMGVEGEHSDVNHTTRYEYEIGVKCGHLGEAPRVVEETLNQGEKLIFDWHPSSNAEIATAALGLRLGSWLSDFDKELDTPIAYYLGQPAFAQMQDNGISGDEYPPMVAIQEALEHIRFIDFSPDSMRKPSTPGQLILSDRGENLSSVLQAICGTPELKSALSHWIQELTPMDVVDFEFVPDAAGKVLVHLVEANGNKISANSASDGTLRFLGMLAALLGPKPAKFFFLEEIDTGIHPSRLALLMDLLEQQAKNKGIQIVATTHSPQVLRLIKPENLKYATLAYRLRGSPETRLKSLPEIPHLMEVIAKSDLARLHESSWMENAMEFSEGAEETFPIEAGEKSS